MKKSLDEFIRQKIGEDRATFDQSYWLEMEKMLDEGKKRRPFFWIWTAGIIGIVLLTFIGFQSIKNSPATSEKIDPIPVKTSPSNFHADETRNDLFEEEKSVDPIEENASQAITGNDEFLFTNENKISKTNASGIDDREIISNNLKTIKVSSKGANLESEEIAFGKKGSIAINEKEILADDNSILKAGYTAKSVIEAGSILQTGNLDGMVAEHLDKDIVRESKRDINLNIVGIQNVKDLEEFQFTTPISPPELAKKSKWALGVQTGWMAFVDNFASETGEKMNGPWLGLSGEFSLSNGLSIAANPRISIINGDYKVFQQYGAISYGFGKGEKVRVATPKTLYTIQIPIILRKRFGNFQIGGGLGTEWLSGVKTTIEDQHKIENYSLANRMEIQSNERNSSNIWLDDSQFITWRVFGQLEATYSLSKRVSIILSSSYFFSELAKNKDDEINKSIISGNNRLQVSIGINYWIK